MLGSAIELPFNPFNIFFCPLVCPHFPSPAQWLVSDRGCSLAARDGRGRTLFTAAAAGGQNLLLLRSLKEWRSALHGQVGTVVLRFMRPYVVVSLSQRLHTANPTIGVATTINTATAVVVCFDSHCHSRCHSHH